MMRFFADRRWRKAVRNDGVPPLHPSGWLNPRDASDDVTPPLPGQSFPGQSFDRPSTARHATNPFGPRNSDLHSDVLLAEKIPVDPADLPTGDRPSIIYQTTDPDLVPEVQHAIDTANRIAAMAETALMSPVWLGPAPVLPVPGPVPPSPEPERELAGQHEPPGSREPVGRTDAALSPPVGVPVPADQGQEQPTSVPTPRDGADPTPAPLLVPRVADAPLDRALRLAEHSGDAERAADQGGTGPIMLPASGRMLALIVMIDNETLILSIGTLPNSSWIVGPGESTDDLLSHLGLRRDSPWSWLDGFLSADIVADN